MRLAVRIKNIPVGDKSAEQRVIRRARHTGIRLREGTADAGQRERQTRHLISLYLLHTESRGKKRRQHRIG